MIDLDGQGAPAPGGDPTRVPGRAGPDGRLGRPATGCRPSLRKTRLDAGPLAERPFGPVTVAKAYRLLHAILATPG